MPAQNKIVKYKLQERILELMPGCDNHRDLAEKLTADLHKRGINDGVSQSTVSRYLKETEEQRASETRAIFGEYVKGTMPRDLEILDHIILRHYNVFKNLQPDPNDPENLVPADYSFSEQSAAAMKAVRVIETKLRFSGILEDKDPEDAAAGAAKKIQDEIEDDLLGKIDVVGTA